MGSWEWLWLMVSFFLRLLVTVQVVVITTVFVLLRSYNPTQEKRYHEGQDVLGRKDRGPFELSACRADSNHSAPSCDNPFENTTWHLTLYERLKLAIMSATVLPLRVLGLVSATLSIWLLLAVLVKLRLFALARLASSCTARVMLFCLGFHHISVTGTRATGVGAIVSNHISFLDGMVWVAVAAPRIFAEQSNFKGGFLLLVARALNIVTFDRGGAESRKAARATMAQAASEAVAGRAPPILVFPEGTTHNSKVMITFKDGAFAPGLPVQPALMRYKFRHCDPCWVSSGPGLPMLVFKLMCQVANSLEVEFLPVHRPSQEERDSSLAFARGVQLQMATAMGVPTTEHSLEDLQLQMAAIKASLPCEVGVIGYSAIRDAFGVDAAQIKDQMLVFKNMQGGAAGRVSCDEFVESFERAFHRPSGGQTRMLQEFFERLTDGQPTLDFRKFLIGLALVPDPQKESQQEGSPARGVSPTQLPSFEEVLARYRSQAYIRLVFAAFAASEDHVVKWREFEDQWLWLYPHRQDESGNSVRATFEEIGGEGDTLSFESFCAYCERHPVFERQLRQAFFGRVSSEFSPH